LIGLLQGFMGLILIALEGLFEWSWLAYLVGGICCGALVVISMSLVFLVKDRGELVIAPL